MKDMEVEVQLGAFFTLALGSERSASGSGRVNLRGSVHGSRLTGGVVDNEEENPLTRPVASQFPDLESHGQLDDSEWGVKHMKHRYARMQVSTVHTQ
jgi:hypothetical protein